MYKNPLLLIPKIRSICPACKKQLAIDFQSAGGYTIQKAETEIDSNADLYGNFSFVVTPPVGMENVPYTVKLADPHGKGYIQDGNFIINMDWNISENLFDIATGISIRTNVLTHNGGGTYTIKCVDKELIVLIMPLSFKQNLSSETKTYSKFDPKVEDGTTYDTPLAVLASANTDTQLDDKAVGYEWYYNTKNSAGGATKLNIDKRVYYIPADQPTGTYYYFVEAFYSDSPTIRIQSKIQRVDIVKEIAKLKLTSDKTSYTYGEDITFTTAVSIPTTRVRAVATANTVDFYCGETKLNSAPITLTESGGTGTATFTYDTTGKGIPTGTQNITAVYGGSDNLKDQTAASNITLNKQQLTATVTGGSTATKVYNGSAELTGVALTLAGVLGGDTISATATGNATKNGTANADAEAAKIFVATSTPTLTGSDAAYYSLDNGAVSGTVQSQQQPQA